MSLSPGDKLGPYEILSPIGTGGMGEVYRARDSRLHRDVAIKVSSARFSERFAQEARAIAALNHANICHLYDVGPDYLVMEYVEGHDLRGPLSFEDALPVVRQLIDGIEAAHEKNIIHRDLKPANIKITPEGVVKILDFGLAKAAEPQPAGDVDPENSPTLTAATQAGAILGTAAYMAPEQARGKTADKRSDIWSFGVILHELLTGKRLFQGESAVEILGSVLNKEPDISAVPPRARKLLRWCLERDRKLRLQAIGDARRMLEEEPESAPVKPRFAIGSAAGLAAGVLLLVALGALSFVHFREKPPVREVVRFEVPPPAGANFVDYDFPAISPDSRKVALVVESAESKSMIWVRSLGTEEVRPVAGTENVSDDPIWSPDGRYLAFRSEGKLKQVDAAGGPAQVLCDAPMEGGAEWISGNRILFGTAGPLQLIPGDGGTPTPLTALDRTRNEVWHLNPRMLPDGHHFLYWRGSADWSAGGTYIGSLDARPDQQSSRKLLSDPAAVYLPSPLTGDSHGFLLFLRGLSPSNFAKGATLMAQPFDPKRMELAGDAVPIAERVTSFSASPAGVLAYKKVGEGNSRLTWYDRKGSLLSSAGEVSAYNDLALSPDGTRVAYQRGAELWLFEFARGGVSTKFTFGNYSADPAWSADGSRIVFGAVRGNGFGIYRKASDLSSGEELVLQSAEGLGIPNWTHDGRFLMYSAANAGGNGYDLWVLPQSGSSAERKPLPFLRTEFNESAGRFSPNGRWIAYWSDQSGKREVYVLPFDPSNPGSPGAGGLHQISKDGGQDPRWSQNGKELFYLALDGYLMSVEVNATSSTFQTGAAQRLFKSPAPVPSTWDVSGDGKRFLIAAPAASGAASSQPYHIVLNWTELLKR